MFANHLREGFDILKSLLALAPARSPARLKALWAAGYLGFYLGEQPPKGSLAPREEGLALARELGEPREIGRFLAGAGSEAIVRGDVARAQAHLDEALTLARQHDDAWLLQVTTMWFGILRWSSGDLGAARQLLEEALVVSPRVPDARTTANTLIVLSNVALLQGDPHRAAALGRDSLAARQGLHDAWSIGVTLAVVAHCDVAIGRFERAARLFGAAEGLQMSVGVTLRMPPRWHDDHVYHVAATRQALDEGTFEAAWAEGQAMTLDEAVAYAQETEPPDPTPVERHARPAPSLLTRREHEVADLIARGLTNAQIAAELIISERTVDTHAEHIRAKLDVRSRAEIAAWVTRHALAEQVLSS